MHGEVNCPLEPFEGLQLNKSNFRLTVNPAIVALLSKQFLQQFHEIARRQRLGCFQMKRQKLQRTKYFFYSLVFETLFTDMADDIYCRLNSANGPNKHVNLYELLLKKYL